MGDIKYTPKMMLCMLLTKGCPNQFHFPVRPFPPCFQGNYPDIRDLFGLGHFSIVTFLFRWLFHSTSIPEEEHLVLC